MKKYTQKELISEGFWRGLGNVIGGAARGLDYVAGKVAPELQSLYKDPYKAAVGLGRAIKGSPTKEVDKSQKNQKSSTVASPQETANIRQGLASKSITLLNTPTLSYTDPKTRLKYFNVRIETKGNEINAIVDSKGNFATP